MSEENKVAPENENAEAKQEATETIQKQKLSHKIN
jgi:hypothetical protein